MCAVLTCLAYDCQANYGTSWAVELYLWCGALSVPISGLSWQNLGRLSKRTKVVARATGRWHKVGSRLGLITLKTLTQWPFQDHLKNKMKNIENIWKWSWDGISSEKDTVASENGWHPPASLSCKALIPQLPQLIIPGKCQSSKFRLTYLSDRNQKGGLCGNFSRPHLWPVTSSSQASAPWSCTSACRQWTSWHRHCQTRHLDRSFQIESPRLRDTKTGILENRTLKYIEMMEWARFCMLDCGRVWLPAVSYCGQSYTSHGVFCGSADVVLWLKNFSLLPHFEAKKQ